MSKGYSRRRFLKGSAAAAGVAALASVSSGPFVLAQQSPGDKLRVAVIGAAGMGGYSVGCALSENLVAMVDVDEKNIAKVMKESVKDTAKPKIFYDYRKMLDECHKDLDVVLIATPDHHHAPAAIRAINYGKHVFCQKPLAHNIAECYALAKAAREKKVLTQMGNQGYCGEAIRRVAEYIAAGAIGTVTETHTMLDRNFGGTGGRPPSKPVPAGLHWDEWIGPAPYRDYHDGLHPFSWRDWKAFGTGTIGDMACHRLAFPFMALRLWEVKKFTVECLNTKNGSDEKYPQDNVVCYHIPARDGLPGLQVLRLRSPGAAPRGDEGAGEEVRGASGPRPRSSSAPRAISTTTPASFPSRSTRSSRCRPRRSCGPRPAAPSRTSTPASAPGGTPASNFIDAAGPLTAMALTGHLAQYAGIGGKIEWDVEKMQCTNKPELNQFVRREYRSGWEV